MFMFGLKKKKKKRLVDNERFCNKKGMLQRPGQAGNRALINLS